jgi:hypothetical protein
MITNVMESLMNTDGGYDKVFVHPVMSMLGSMVGHLLGTFYR